MLPLFVVVSSERCNTTSKALLSGLVIDAMTGGVVTSKVSDHATEGWRAVGNSAALTNVYNGAPLRTFYCNLFGANAFTMLNDCTWIRAKGANEVTVEHADYYYFKEETKIFSNNNESSSSSSSSASICNCLSVASSKKQDNRICSLCHGCYHYPCLATTYLKEKIDENGEWHCARCMNLPLPYYTCWISLSDISSQEGRLALIPGSHLLGRYEDPVIKSLLPGGYTEAYKKKAVWVTPNNIGKGDVILFNMKTVHAATKNVGAKFRISMDTRMALSADVSMISQDHRPLTLVLGMANVSDSYCINSRVFPNTTSGPIRDRLRLKELEKTHHLDIITFNNHQSKQDCGEHKHYQGSFGSRCVSSLREEFSRCNALFHFDRIYLEYFRFPTAYLEAYTQVPSMLAAMVCDGMFDSTTHAIMPNYAGLRDQMLEKFQRSSKNQLKLSRVESMNVYFKYKEITDNKYPLWQATDNIYATTVGAVNSTSASPRYQSSDVSSSLGGFSHKHEMVQLQFGRTPFICISLTTSHEESQQSFAEWLPVNNKNQSVDSIPDSNLPPFIQEQSPSKFGMVQDVDKGLHLNSMQMGVEVRKSLIPNSGQGLFISSSKDYPMLNGERVIGYLFGIIRSKKRYNALIKNPSCAIGPEIEVVEDAAKGILRAFSIETTVGDEYYIIISRQCPIGMINDLKLPIDSDSPLRNQVVKIAQPNTYAELHGRMHWNTFPVTVSAGLSIGSELYMKYNWSREEWQFASNRMQQHMRIERRIAPKSREEMMAKQWMNAIYFVESPSIQKRLKSFRYSLYNGSTSTKQLKDLSHFRLHSSTTFPGLLGLMVIKKIQKEL